MEQKKIDMFLAQNAQKLPTEKIVFICEALSKLEDSQFSHIQCIELKDPSTIVLLSVILGSWGLDRFMLDEAGLGVAKLLTCGGAGIWWLIDAISAADRTRTYNYNKIKQVLLFQGATSLY